MKNLGLNFRSFNVKSWNWFGLVGGALTLVLTVASMFVPWWQITVGRTLAIIGLSPVSLSTNIVGFIVALPIIAAVSWMFMVLLISAGIILIIYSIVPTKPYSERLLGFAYKKPLGTLIAFVVLMLLLTNAGTVFGMMSGPSLSGADLNVPWTGAKTLHLPSSMAQGTLLGIAISAEIEWTFWLAVIVAGLCVAARLYHKKLVRPTADKKTEQTSQE
ncbi:MAG TPA: hypothetical protein VK487_10010 [Candidatus Bathyarchaeia archaeon]|nr:hypothetical protein [Candidatus Bathyarchaeia archaeon]